MKYKRIIRILAIAIILPLLMVVIPANPAHAAYYEDIYLDPDSGEIGDYVYVDGYDFNESTATLTIEVDIYFSSDETEAGYRIGGNYEVTIYEKVKSTVWVDTYGEFTNARFKVPTELTDGDDEEDVHGGTYYVYVTYEGETRIRAVATFTVIAGEIELDYDEGPVGTEVEITGTGFTEDEDITIEYDNEDVDIESGDTETDSDGEFASTILIPESEVGDHTITVSDESGSEAEAVFTVECKITISPTSGPPDTLVTVSGTGFKASKYITITFAGSEVNTTPASIKTNSAGSFSGTFAVLSLIGNTYQVKASDDTNKYAVNFTISAGATLSPTTGDVGTTLTISGTGFIASGTVTIKYDDVEVKTATADTNGAFAATFNAPASKSGEHTILVSDGTSTKQLTFTMESTAPPIPTPLLPKMGVKAKAEAYFDWEDVTDDSLPVTYTLQIASDKDFTTMVLEKKGLTKSEYTITTAEKLPSTSKEAPYYWRVKAVDGASNESGWTGAGSFYVGFSFALTGWILYTLIGIGGLLLLLIGYRLGRRTAYY